MEQLGASRWISSFEWATDGPDCKRFDSTLGMAGFLYGDAFCGRIVTAGTVEKIVCLVDNDCFNDKDIQITRML